jgi:hypothetical protein
MHLPLSAVFVGRLWPALADVQGLENYYINHAHWDFQNFLVGKDSAGGDIKRMSTQSCCGVNFQTDIHIA